MWRVCDMGVDDLVTVVVTWACWEAAREELVPISMTQDTVTSKSRVIARAVTIATPFTTRDTAVYPDAPFTPTGILKMDQPLRLNRN